MRRGDFSVEVVPVGDDAIREIESGHVLARPGAVYALRLRNLGPLRCVAQIEIDGKAVTAGGLVIDAYGTVTLERPVDAGETGRFTVVAEGDERVFGPDGGRDNAQLGCIDARFRRELPRAGRREVEPVKDPLGLPHGWNLEEPIDVPPPRPRPMAPPEWTPPGFELRSSARRPSFSAISRTHDARDTVVREAPASVAPPGIERAAGTGLTGHSAQEFETIVLGPLETEATLIRLRLVIGSEDALSAPRPLPADRDEPAPTRPAARP